MREGSEWGDQEDVQRGQFLQMQPYLSQGFPLGRGIVLAPEDHVGIPVERFNHCLEDTDFVLFRRAEVRVYHHVILGALLCSEASNNLHLRLQVAQGLFCQVVVKRHIKVSEEAPHFVSLLLQPQTKIFL